MRARQSKRRRAKAMSNEAAVRQTDAIARPESFEGLMQMAKVLVDSKFLPAAIDTPAKAAAIMVAGREIGLTGMQSFRELYSVKGQIGMSTRLIAAFFKRAGGQYIFLERNDGKCTVRLTLPNGSERDYTLTRAEADQAGYTKEKDKDGQLGVKFNWKANPTGMLSNNCLKGAIRLWCPECLLDVMGPTQMAEPERVEVVEAEVVEGEAHGYDPDEFDPKDPDHQAAAAEAGAKPDWAPGVILSNAEGKKDHWYNWKAFRDQFWAWADKQTLDASDVCDLLGIPGPDEIATLNLTMKGIVEAINKAIAEKKSEPEPTELLM
jgi:hypothetical protein